jgi:hypothetical protein
MQVSTLFKTYTICDLLVAAISQGYTVHARPTINVAKRKNDGRDVGYIPVASTLKVLKNLYKRATACF